MINFSKIDKISQRIIAAFLGVSLSLFSGFIGFTLLKSSRLTYSSGETNLNIDTVTDVKSSSNDIEYANNQLQKKLILLEKDIQALKHNFDYDPNIGLILNHVEESVKQIEPVANEIDKSTNELKEVTQEAIAK